MSAHAPRTEPIIEAKILAATLARLAHDKKAAEIVVLEVTERLRVADYFVLVTGLNRNHVRALENELHVHTKAQGIRHHPAEGEGLYWWVVLDFGDVVVHVMQAEARQYYDLEHLYVDCPRLDWRAVEVPALADARAAEA